MKTVICVPLAPNDARRQHIWKWLRHEWIEHYFPDWPIHEATAIGAGNARNLAARAAGQWDTALFWDADTIAHPEAVQDAVQAATNSMELVVAADSHMYCSEASSDRIMAGGPLLGRPYRVDREGIHRAVYPQPCSGVFAMSRSLWNATGGYIEIMGADGCEDQAMMELTRIYGDGIKFIPGHMTYHLWHEPGPERWRKQPANYPRNRQIWLQLARYAKNARYRNNLSSQAAARRFLAEYGHTIPIP